MNTHTIAIQSPDRRVPQADSPDRPDTKRQAAAAGAARILRRWSVADLIARAGGAPRAFA